MSSNERVVRALERGLRTQRDVADHTGMTLRAVQQAMTRLERKGVVRREGFGFVLTEAAEGVLA